MGAKSVYFTDDCEKIINQLKTGELSKLCQKAVRENSINSKNIKVWEEKLKLIEEEEKRLSAQNKVITKKILDLEEQEDIEERKKINEEMREFKIKNLKKND